MQRYKNKTRNASFLPIFFALCSTFRTFAAEFQYWTVTWLNGSIDIAPEHLYEMSMAA
jgi:hypothetical protein